MTKRSTMGGGTVLALALIFIGLTILFNYAFRGWRLDLTENRLYTIAPGTQNILKSLKEPINLYFFYSEKVASRVPQAQTYGKRVREFLEEITMRANGKLRLQIIDPQPFSEEEDRAAELGIRPMPLDSMRSSQFYFGLAATNATDGKAAIEFFDPGKEEFLEYDVIKLIYQLANPKKPVVGWMSGLPTTMNVPIFDPSSGGAREPWVVFSQAQQLFDVRHLSLSSTTIDEDIDVLVIAHPKDVSPQAQFAIDQFALRGGRIVVFVDPIAEADPAGQNQDPQNPMAGMTADKSSNLPRLFEAWGIEYDPRQVVADLERALVVSTHPSMPPSRHLGILGLDESSFNRSDVVTAGLSTVNVATAGHVKPKKGASVQFEPLLQSSNQAATLGVERFQMLFDPSSLLDGFKPTGERYTLAARVTGKVKSAFPDGPPEGVELPEGKQPLKESAQPLNLVVFADTDLLSDMLWVRQQSFFGQRFAQAFAHNGDLVHNVLDNLAGSSDLISVRGRASFTRPFDRVEAIRRNAEARFRAKEQELEKELRETDERLRELESKQGEDTSLILTPEQQAEIERFQKERLRIRKELREVRLDMDQDIKRLGNVLKFINIVAVPVIFALAALFVAVWRRRRRIAAPMMQKEKEASA